MKEVPSFDQLMWPTIVALRETGGSATNDELLAKVIDVLRVPDEVASIVHTDNRQSRLNYNLAWAKTYLKKAGAVENSQRGVWSLTERGEAWSETEVAKVPAEVRKADYEQRQKGSRVASEDSSNDLPAIDESSWKDQLLATLQRMSPSAFERLAQRLLRESGFVKVEVTGRSGDVALTESECSGFSFLASPPFSSASDMSAPWVLEPCATSGVPW